MSRVTKPILLDETGQRMAAALEAIAIGGAIGSDDTWEQVRNIVRGGLGAKAYPIGTQFVAQHSTYGAIKLDVVSHANYVNPLTAGPVMALKMHDGISGLPFDAKETLHYCAEALPAGQYHFTLSADEGGTSYGFTLTQPVPAGGVITVDGTSGATITSVTTYPGREASEPIETANVNAGSTTGTALSGINTLSMAQQGYNHWGESNMRQWLNSDAESDWWQPQTIFDRPPAGSASQAGFLAGFDAEFKNVLCAVNVVTAYNHVANHSGAVSGVYTTRDKVFLPSIPEMGITSQSGMEGEGTLLPYYDGLTDAEKIIYDISGTHPARAQWLRSAYATRAYSVRDISATGSAGSYAAVSTAPAVAPLICIG